MLQVVSIFDSAADVYSRPVFVASLAQAVRSFSDEVNRVGPDNELNRHPQDFQLFHVATFDDNKGEFVNVEGGANMVVEAKRCVREVNG